MRPPDIKQLSQLLTECSFQATSSVLRYQRTDGTEPFTDWLNSLRDKAAAARIRLRLRQLEAGNFGDHKSLGAGVSELRFHHGPGYRVYFGRHGSAVVLLLCGGDKASQAADIGQAQAYWNDWKARQS
jgi:putative addiction module killer protein